MPLKSGDKVFYRFVGERTEYPATIKSCDDDSMVVETNLEKCPKIARGQYLSVSTSEEVYNAEVINAEACFIKLRRLRTDMQDYFRIDDFFPVVARRVPNDFSPKKSSVSLAYTNVTLDRSLPDDGSVNPKLWELLISVNEKLNLILDRLNLETRVVEAEPQNVNISASGIRFTMKEKVEIGDTIEVKMLLPSSPPVTILAYGAAVGVQAAGGSYAVAVQFVDLDEEVRDRIIQYTLNRQREVIRRQRQLNE